MARNPSNGALVSSYAQGEVETVTELELAILGGCDEDARDAVITDGAMAKAAGSLRTVRSRA